MRKLSDLADVNPKRQLPSGLSLDEEVSFIPMGDVSEAGEWVCRQTRQLKELLLGFTPFREGDVLFAKITPCMENGKGTHAIGLKHGIGFGSTEFHVLRAKQNVSDRFIFHLCQSKRLRLAAEAHMIGSAGQQRVQKQFFDRYEVLELPVAEQKKIAQILDTLDTQNRQTEALIAKLERIKQGLLTDLLTRGIDQNGQLRPTPDQAPHLYKDSPLGRIPREWEVRPVAELCYLGRGRVISQLYLAEHPGPYPVYSSQTKDEGVFGRIDTYDFEGPHVTWTTDGANAGTVTYRDGRFNCTNVCGTLKGKDDNTYMPFLAQALGRYTSRYVSRVGNDKLMNNVVASIPVQVPPVREQRMAYNKLGLVDDRLETERAELTKLMFAKTALMEDLLTGRVRVIPLLDAAEQAHG